MSDIDIGTLYQEGLAKHRLGDLHAAQKFYLAVLDLSPTHAGALHFLGVVFLAHKKFAEALSYLEKAIAFCSSKAVYYNNYGVALNELHRLPEAKDAFQRAIALDPGYADAYSNLGLVYFLQNENRSAQIVLEQALMINADHPDALRHLSELHIKQEHFHKALPLIEAIAAQNPANAQLQHQLGCLNGDCGNVAQAKFHFQRAANMSGGKSVWKWKHLWYCPTFFENEEQIDEYWGNLNHDLDAAIAEKPLYDWRTLVYDGFTHSFNLPHHNRCCKNVLEKFAKLFAPSFPFERPTYKPCKKIRVGFLVTAGHEGGFLRLTTGLIEQLDPEKFEVVLIYSETAAARFEKKFTRTDLIRLPFSQNFEEAVHAIRAARCDVIYYWKVAADLWSFFLPMCRLAPIQATSWSTHGTSGLEQLDYYVSWEKAEIADAESHYTEKLVSLETTPLYEPLLTDIPKPATRGELGLPETGAIYFCPHRPQKYHPVFDDYLRQILQRDPSGHVVLFMGKHAETVAPLVQRMRSAVGEKSHSNHYEIPELKVAKPATTGVLGKAEAAVHTDFGMRLIFLPHQSVPQYYRYLSSSTVLLNSPIYSGEITAIDGFLYGIPCVAQTGEFLVQRYSSAFYDAFGISGPAAENKEQYVEEAVRLGTDEEYRSAIVHQILENHSWFFENKKTVQEWERFLTTAVHGEKRAEHSGIRCENPAAKSKVAVPMGNLEINVAYGCNLRCNYCSHFCPWMSGLASTDELIEWYQTWNTKVMPANIRLIGGEPLLHPELATIILETKKYWKAARIDLVTNGLLLSQRTEILVNMKAVGGHVFLSKHFNHEPYNRNFEESLHHLRLSGVPFTVYTSDRLWRKYYDVNADGKPIPYVSDAEKAWLNCQTKNVCPTLLGNRIYKCQHLAYAMRGVQTGSLLDSWKRTLDYQPLSVENTAAEIMTHLAGGAIPECSICPECYEYVPLDEKKSFFLH